MQRFEHGVADAVRQHSNWDDVTASYIAPDGRRWHYTDDPLRDGKHLCDEQGKPIRIAVWLIDPVDDPEGISD